MKLKVGSFKNINTSNTNEEKQKNRLLISGMKGVTKDPSKLKD